MSETHCADYRSVPLTDGGCMHTSRWWQEGGRNLGDTVLGLTFWVARARLRWLSGSHLVAPWEPPCGHRVILGSSHASHGANVYKLVLRKNIFYPTYIDTCANVSQSRVLLIQEQTNIVEYRFLKLPCHSKWSVLTYYLSKVSFLTMSSIHHIENSECMLH